MKMTVTRHWPEITAFDGTQVQPKDQPCVFNPCGWTSVAEMQKELIRRFPHDKPVKIDNGILYTKGSFGTTMSVTLTP